MNSVINMVIKLLPFSNNGKVQCTKRYYSMLAAALECLSLCLPVIILSQFLTVNMFANSRIVLYYSFIYYTLHFTNFY